MWIKELWNLLFALPPKQELVAIQPPPYCRKCGSPNVEVVGTWPVRKFLCKRCGKSSEETETATVPVKEDSIVWHRPAPRPRHTSFRDLGQFAIQTHAEPGDRIDALVEQTLRRKLPRDGG